MYKLLLSFNFYYGDIYGRGSKDILLEYIKTFLPVFTLILGIMIQKYISKKDESKKNKLQLFNFNEHIKSIVKKTEPITPSFNEFVTNILKDPFNDHLLKDRFILPDVKRILEMDQEKIFSAFYDVYGNKIEAAIDYRRSYNSIELIKETIDILYKKYDSISDDIYNQKIKLKDKIEYLRQATSDSLLDSSDNPQRTNFSEKHAPINKIFITYLTGIENSNKPLQYHVDYFLTPLRDTLLKYKDEPETRIMLSQIKECMNLKDDIIYASEELGELIKSNMENIPNGVSILDKISKTLSSKLSEYYN